MNKLFARLFYILYRFFLDDDKPVKTALHPDYKRLIQYAFTSTNNEGKSIDFYQFESAADMPIARYQIYSDFLEDYNRRFSNEELKDAVAMAREQLISGEDDAAYKCLSILEYINERTSMAMDIDLFLQFCSVAFFTIDEDLLSYDYDIGDQKIKLWRREGLHAFFLKKPVKTFLASTNLSKADLMILEAQKRGMKRFLKKFNKSGAK